MADLIAAGGSFDEPSHVYRDPSGAVLDSVTTIIAPLTDYGSVPAAILEFARERGGHVHRACELHDSDDLVMDTLDIRLLPYVQAWQQFRKDYPCTWEHVERPEWSPILRYAGTPDRRGVFLRERKRLVLEIKATAVTMPSVAVQLSGYDLTEEPRADELWVVRLRKDGRYRRAVMPAVHGTFLSCLNIFNWKRKNK